MAQSMCFIPAVDKAEVHRRQKRYNIKNLIGNKTLSGQAFGGRKVRIYRIESRGKSCLSNIGEKPRSDNVHHRVTRT